MSFLNALTKFTNPSLLAPNLFMIAVLYCSSDKAVFINSSVGSPFLSGSICETTSTISFLSPNELVILSLKILSFDALSTLLSVSNESMSKSLRAIS